MIDIFKRKKVFIFIGCFLIIFSLFFFTVQRALSNRDRLMEVYKDGVNLIKSEDYQKGIDILQELGDYQNCLQYIEYAQAKLLFSQKQYEQAKEKFLQIGSFLDSEDCVKEIDSIINKQKENENLYIEASNYYDSEEFEEAKKIFAKLGDYKDSRQLLQKCIDELELIKRQEQANTFSAWISDGTISAGIRFSAGVTKDGTVYFSGENFDGEDDIATWTDIVSISVNGHIVVGLKKDGTVVTAGGLKNYRIDTSFWRNIIAVAAGQQYIVGLKDDGTLTAQGHNGDGQTEIDSWTGIKAIATGWRHTVGLDSDGNIHITGYGALDQLSQIESHKEEWTDIVAISAGGGSNEKGKRGHTVALKSDGTVVAVGDNGFGQCNVSEWTDIVAIAAGDFHTVGLKKDKTVVTTQTDPQIQKEISSWTDIVAVASGYGFTLGLKSDGTVVSSGYSLDGQRETESWKNIVYPEERDVEFGNS